MAVKEVTSGETLTPQQEPAPKVPSKVNVNLSSGLSGAISGVLVGACLQPLDVLRTRMQGDSAKGLQMKRQAEPTTITHTID